MEFYNHEIQNLNKVGQQMIKKIGIYSRSQLEKILKKKMGGGFGRRSMQQHFVANRNGKIIGTVNSCKYVYLATTEDIILVWYVVDIW